jgi:hypothetical protein
MPSITHIQTALAELLDTTSMTQRSRQRLAFLVLGVLLSGSVVLRRIATTSALVERTATHAASHERRLRRTLRDEQLHWAATYARTVRRVLRRPTRGPWVVIIDESGHSDVVRALVAALWYRGRAIPLAWVVWTGQAPHEQAYWTDTAALLDQVAAVLPPGGQVRVLADRAFGCPAFTDQVAAHGWEWLVRVQGQTRLRHPDGSEQSLKTMLTAPGQHWCGRGQIFKKGGWRDAHVLAYWRVGQRDPLLVVSNGPGGLRLASQYRQRSAIETLFRDWKTSGWQWEASQMHDRARQERVILALAYATLVTLCLGDEAATRITQAGPQTGTRRPWAARDSLFQLGRQRFWQRIWQGDTSAITWELAHPDAPTWSVDCWQAALPEPTPLFMTDRVGKREHRRAA